MENAIGIDMNGSGCVDTPVHVMDVRALTDAKRHKLRIPFFYEDRSRENCHISCLHIRGAGKRRDALTAVAIVGLYMWRRNEVCQLQLASSAGEAS